jgi:uncharacterized protein (TIGR00369 family)
LGDDVVDDVLAFARQVFDSQPFSRFIGAKLVSATRESVELALALQDHHRQQHGFAHGGVISYLADNAITFAGGLALGGNALTVEFKINYLRPAIGDRLIAVASARSAGKRTAVCQCDLFAMEGETRKLCALAQGTVAPAG